MIRLRELRERTGKTMKEVAADLGVKYSTYITYEKGIYEPNLLLLQQMAQYYNVSIEYLVGRTDDPRTIADKQRDEDGLNKYLEMLRTRPEMRILLDTVAGATKEEVEANVHFLEAMRKKD